MQRRDFIRLLTTSAVAVGSYPLASFKSYATEPTEFLITIGADGGWDTTSLFDPKGVSRGVNRVAIDNSLVTPSGIRWSAVPSSLGDSQARIVDQYKRFFTTYGDQLTIIRGLDAMTIGHRTGSKVKLSGAVDGTYPSLGASYAAVYGEELPLSYLTFGSQYGGADYTAGLNVTKALLGNGELISKLGDPALGQSPEVYDLIMQKHLNRLTLQAEKERQSGGLPIYAKKMEQFLKQRLQPNLFKPMADNLAQINDTNMFNPDWYTDRAQALKLQARITAASFATGTSCSASLMKRGFDSHVNNDTVQYNHLGDLLEGIHYLVESLNFFGIAEQTTIVVASDIGRSSTYNQDQGKDHGTTTGMMVLHPKSSVLGGRVFGETTDDYGAQNINFETGVSDPNGTRLNVAHMVAALREHLGLAGASQLSNFGFGGIQIPKVFF